MSLKFVEDPAHFLSTSNYSRRSVGASDPSPVSSEHSTDTQAWLLESFLRVPGSAQILASGVLLDFGQLQPKPLESRRRNSALATPVGLQYADCSWQRKSGEP